MEVFVLNKNMSVFFSFVPRFYYILPWRLRLVPKSFQEADQDDDVDGNIDDEHLDEEEKRDDDM